MTIKSTLKSLIKKLPGISRIVAQRDQLLAQHEFVPPGHFLSPIISISEYLRDEENLAAAPTSSLLGVDLNIDGQIAMLSELAPFWHDNIFPLEPTTSRRYFVNNLSFNRADAMSLQAMIRHFKPRRFIEVGSGMSSGVTLDTNEFYFNNTIKVTFIEPYPQLLKKLVRLEDLARNMLLQSRLQDVPLEVFSALQKDDVLFIDSTHVSKFNSDVNYLFFEILPRLAAGVIVHIHDIFFPFDYPREWILEGRSWNEAYLLRAFLQYNQHVEVLLFNSYLHSQQNQSVNAILSGEQLNGGSVWLRVKPDLIE